MLNNDEREEVEGEPMGDDDIKRYFPNADIIVYNDLNKYNTMDDLLPTDKSFCFMLIESSPQKGHWVSLLKYGDTIEHFCSYGTKIDGYISWNDKITNQELGQQSKQLTNLLKQHKGGVVYNPIKYQGSGADVNTCGRHCTFRIQQMKDGKNLDEYYNYMKRLKNNMGVDFDGVVANFIRE